MSDKGKSNQEQSSFVKAISFGALAIAGAYTAYCVGHASGQEEAVQQIQHQVPAANRTQKVVDSDIKAKSEDASDEKLVRECDICLTDFSLLKSSDIEIHSTPCGHIFCKGCIDDALAQQPRCPICRKTVFPNQTLRIFL